MALRTIATEGPWTLVGTIDTVPEWVGWVHRDAERWRQVVIDLAAEGRRLGLGDHTVGRERWADRYRLTLALTRALGQLARALDLPITCFAPWSRRMWRNDAGSLAWPGWGLANWGVWRVAAIEDAARYEEHVRGAANVQLQLAHRVGLTYEGELSTPVAETAGAAQTSRGEDWNGRSCRAGAPDNNWWECLPLSVWWPGAGSADRDVYVSATVPLRWHWDMALGAADDVRDLEDIEHLVAMCRYWTAQKNLKAVAYMRDLGPVEGRQNVTVSTPADLLLVGASDQLQNLQPVRVAGVNVAAAFRAVGEAVVTMPPVGTVIGAVLIALAEVLRAFGTAMGAWHDQWGRREPALEVPRLTGALSTTVVQPPTHAVAAPPAAPSSPSATLDPEKAALEAELEAKEKGELEGGVLPITPPRKGGAMLAAVALLALALAAGRKKR